MNFLRTTWGVCLLGALALPGCGGDDTPTPNGLEGEAGPATGAGGAGNDASSGSDTSTGKAGGTTDSGTVLMCKKTDAMAVTGQDIATCKAGLPEAGSDAGGASCFSCLCSTCPLEANTCNGDPNCKAIPDCCRTACKCATATPEAGSDAPVTGEASTTDAPAADGAAE